MINNCNPLPLVSSELIILRQKNVFLTPFLILRSLKHVKKHLKMQTEDY